MMDDNLRKPENPEAWYHDVEAGDNIHNAIATIVSRFPGYCVFNDILLESKAAGAEEEDRLLKHYHDEMNRRHTEWLASSAGQESERKNQKEIADRTALLSEYRARLPSLNMSEYGDMLKFFADTQDTLDFIGVPGCAEFATEIVAHFQTHGLVPNMNINDPRVETDSEIYARWLIGQALSGISTVGAPHPVFHHFYETWKNLFP